MTHKLVLERSGSHMDANARSRCRPAHRLLLLVGVLLAEFGLPGPAHAVPITITFDEPFQLPDSAVTIGMAVEDYYWQTLGVRFENAKWDPHEPEFEGHVGIDSLASGPYVAPDAPIVVVFAVPVKSVSLWGLDVGSAGMRADAFVDPGATVLATFDQTFGLGLGDGPKRLELGAAVIRRLHLYQPAFDAVDGTNFDNLTFEAVPVPEPATWVLLGLGLVGVAIARWPHLSSAPRE